MQTVHDLPTMYVGAASQTHAAHDFGPGSGGYQFRHRDRGLFVTSCLKGRYLTVVPPRRSALALRNNDTQQPHGHPGSRLSPL